MTPEASGLLPCWPTVPPNLSHISWGQGSQDMAAPNLSHVSRGWGSQDMEATSGPLGLLQAGPLYLLPETRLGP